MMQFFKKLFGKTKKTTRNRVWARLQLEAFEARDLLSGCSGLLAARGANLGTQSSPSAQTGTSTTRQTTVDYSGQLHSAASTGTTSILVATLSGATGAAGTVKFTANTTAGTNSLTLAVSGLTASQTYTVQVDGTTIGQVTTDTSGNGSVSLSNLTAAIAAGSIVTVVDTSTTPSTTALQGTLAAGHTCGGGSEQHRGPSFSASLTGATGTAGSAAVWTNATTGQSNLKVSVSGLTASTSYTVEIGSTSVGQVTTDTNGTGKVVLSNLTATIAAGTTISIVDAQGNTVLTGTFAAGGSQTATLSSTQGQGFHHH